MSDKLTAASKRDEATKQPLVDYQTDTALHPFMPDSGGVLCAVCGEHQNWHEPATER